jgi:hypothetical protein
MTVRNYCDDSDIQTLGIISGKTKLVNRNQWWSIPQKANV